MRRDVVRLPDGRDLEYWQAGPDDGELLIFHHGTPSDGEPFPPDARIAAERGLRTVGPSRPGMGASARREGRAVADCAADTAALADHLGVDRFLVAGHSGGGPHSLACAALLPDRVRAALVIASAAPFSSYGEDWRDAMGSLNVEAVEAHLAGTEACQAFTEREARGLVDITGAEILDMLGDLVSETDRPFVTGELADFFARTTRRALSQGWEGWWDDGEALFDDWGFDLGAIGVPVTLWHGEDDRFCPFAEGRWLAERVAGVRAHLLPGEGHLSIVGRHLPTMLDELLELASERA